MHKNYLGITYFITKGIRSNLFYQYNFHIENQWNVMWNRKKFLYKIGTNWISKIMKIELITSFSSLDLGMSHLNSFYNDYLSKVTDKIDANEFCPCGNSW